jgi:hypothetical protein
MGPLATRPVSRELGGRLYGDIIPRARELADADGPIDLTGDIAGLGGVTADAMADIAGIPVTTEEGAAFLRHALRLIAAQAAHAACGQIVARSPTVAGVSGMLACLEPVNATVILSSRAIDELQRAMVQGLVTPLDGPSVDASASTYHELAQAFWAVQQGADQVAPIADPIIEAAGVQGLGDVVQVAIDQAGWQSPGAPGPEAFVEAELQGFLAASACGCVAPTDVAESLHGSDPIAVDTMGVAWASLITARLDAVSSGIQGPAGHFRLASWVAPEDDVLTTARAVVSEARDLHARLVDRVLQPRMRELREAGLLSPFGEMVGTRLIAQRWAAFREAILRAAIRHSLGGGVEAELLGEVGGPTASDPGDLLGTVPPGGRLHVRVGSGGGVTAPGDRLPVMVSGTVGEEHPVLSTLGPSAVARIVDGILEVRSAGSPLAAVGTPIWVVALSGDRWGIADVVVVGPDADGDLLADAWEVGHDLDPTIREDAIATLLELSKEPEHHQV